MSASEIAKFEHVTGKRFGAGSAFQQLCTHHSIITHRKMKDMHGLEYVDSASSDQKNRQRMRLTFHECHAE